MRTSTQSSTPIRAAQGVLGVSWPFLTIVVCLVSLSFFSMGTLSAGRAYVGGESLWSKGEKIAVQELELYVETGSAVHYTKFLNAIAVPLGDREARLELEKPHPNERVVTAGFVQGGNNPADVPGMARLFRWFGQYGEVGEAIKIWRTADPSILRLVQLGDKIHRLVLEGQHVQAAAMMQDVREVDDQLTPLEVRFSASLGMASRQAEALLQVVTVLAALTMVLGGLYRTRRLVLSERLMAEALQSSETRLRLAITASDHGIWDIDLQKGTVHLSASFMATLGYVNWPDQAPLSQVVQVLHPDDRAMLLRRVQEDDGQDTGREFEYRLLSATGGVRWTRIHGGVVRDAHGNRVRMAGAIQDVTEQKTAQIQLFEQRERAVVTLESLREGVITTDAEGHIDYLNGAAEVVIGVHAAELRGRPIAAIGCFVDELTREALQNPLEHSLGRGVNGLLPPGALLLQPDGGEVAIDASASLLHAPDSTVFGAVLVLRNVTQERAATAKLTHQALHDSLTGLPNRRDFEHSLAILVAESGATADQHALMYLDLDQFKIVNDSYGHSAGDQILVEISQLMRGKLRATDVLARLGGDEFGVLLHNCSAENAVRIAEGLRDAVARYRYVIGSRAFSLGVSIGVVHLDGHYPDAATALRAGDQACYAAKEGGRNRIEVASITDDAFKCNENFTQFAMRIQDALEQGRLCLFAQRIEPAIHCKQVPLHIEVLVRMRDRDGKLVLPQEFLPAAERYKLIGAVDRWVIQSTFATLAQWGEEMLDTCSINISGASLVDDRFAQFILNESGRHKISHEKICFEITETAIVTDFNKARSFIDLLQGEGFRFAIDDFGAGMASFAYIRNFPVDYIKIDGSFIKNMASEITDCALVDGIHHIAGVLGLRTVAEFVENDAIRALLAEIGVNYVQGFGIHRPESLETILSAAYYSTQEKLNG